MNRFARQRHVVAIPGVVAPSTFAVANRVRLVRQPETPDEERACAAAALVCPAQAIHAEAPA